MIVNTVFLVVIFALTIYGVFHGEDLGAMMEAMRRADVRWLLPGLFCVVFFIWGESIIIWYMMHSFQIPVKKRTCFLFSSVGFFFSCITPSASGGQPMQLYYMKKEKISLPVSTVILMIVTITYKAVLVVVGLGLVLFGQGFLHRYLTEILPVFYLGIGLNVFCVTAMLILVFHPALARTILVLGLKIVEKLHLMKRKESRLKKLEASMEVYQNTAAYLGTHKMVLVNVLAITFAQRFALFAATWFVYHAFHLSGISFITIVLLQAVISVSVDMLPLPGGMGISETLFLKIFPPVFGSTLLLSGNGAFQRARLLRGTAGECSRLPSSHSLRSGIRKEKKEGELHMIGFYDYTVILTYISFASSISGIFLATRGHFNWAIFCLAFSGLCDMFDGKIARTKKNRTEDEKRFGIQIDSLCDVVCFGVFPIVLCYELGMTHFYSIPILIFYGLAGVIRLGYFNVMEEKRQNETSENRKYYQGLPITSMSVALPLLFVFAPLCRGYFLIWLHLRCWRSAFCLSRISASASRRIKSLLCW